MAEKCWTHEKKIQPR